MPWGLLHLASSAFAHRVSVTNPIDGTPVSVALGVTLVTPSGNWQTPFIDWLKRVSFQSDIQVETGTPTGFEETGAIDALRRVGEQTMAEILGPKGDKVDVLPASLSDLANFDSTAVRQVDPKKYQSRFPWIVNSLDRLLSPQRPGLYHVIKDSLEQVAIRRLQHRAVIHVPPIAMSLMATSSIEEMMRAFEKRELVQLLARMSVVYHYVEHEKSPKKPIRVAIADRHAIENLVTERLLKNPSGIITFDLDAVRLLRTLYPYKGPGQLSKNMQEYQSERSRHLIRIAVLVALLRDAIQSNVTIDDIRTAELILASSEESLQTIYLAVGMGAIGRVLALLVEAHEVFKDNKSRLTYNSAIAWAATSGIPVDQSKKHLDSLIDAKLVETTDSGELVPVINVSKSRMPIMLKRIKLIDKLT